MGRVRVGHKIVSEIDAVGLRKAQSLAPKIVAGPLAGYPNPSQDIPEIEGIVPAHDL